jgi:acylphosphatase
MVKQARILIEGRLQGMNFRLNTQQQANQLGLNGFVRTLSDGRIEIEVQGDESQVEELLNWCLERPHSNYIKNIFYRFDDVEKTYTDFTVR